MPNRLFLVHGSHPSATVEKALQLKGIPYTTVELPPPSHMAVVRALFPRRTVPALWLESGEKVQGSGTILRRLEELRPMPPLLPADPAERARVEEVERWGDDVFQTMARRVLWEGLSRRPEAMPSYQAGGKLPPLPVAVLKLIAPVVTGVEKRAHSVTPERVAADLREVPAHLDRIDGWIADGTLGGEPPNAADLQIFSGYALLHTIGDVRPLMRGRPGVDVMRRLFPDWPGDLPAGVLTPAAA